MMLFHAVEFHSCIEIIVGCQAPVIFQAYFIDLPGVFSYLTQKTQKAQKGAITDGDRGVAALKILRKLNIKFIKNPAGHEYQCGEAQGIENISSRTRMVRMAGIVRRQAADSRKHGKHMVRRSTPAGRPQGEYFFYGQLIPNILF